MSNNSADFTQWVDSVLAGTGWTTDALSAAHDCDAGDLAGAALCDGFAAAERGRLIAAAQAEWDAAHAAQDDSEGRR